MTGFDNEHSQTFPKTQDRSNVVPNGRIKALCGCLIMIKNNRGYLIVTLTCRLVSGFSKSRKRLVCLAS